MFKLSKNAKADTEKETTQTGGQKTADRPAAVRLPHVTRHFSIIMLLVMLAAAAGIAAVYSNMRGISADVAKLKDKVTAELVNAGLSQAINAQIERIKLLSVDPAIIKFIENYDEQQLARLADLYASQSADILKLRFFKPGFLATDKDPVAPVSYASIDLTRRVADARQVMPLEVHSPNTPSSHIALAAPIMNADQQVVGIVLASLAPGVFTDIINAADRKLAGLKLEQVVGENVIELVRSGGFDQTQKTTGIDVPRSIWRLRYHTVATAPGFIQAWSLVAVAIIALIVVLLLLLLQMQFRKKLHADMDKINDFISEKIASKKSVATPAGIHFAESADLADKLAELEFVKKGGTFRGKKITRNQSAEVSPEASKDQLAAGSTDSNPGKKAAAKEDLELLPTTDSGNGVFPSKVTQSSGDIQTLESGVSDLPSTIFREYDIRGIIGKTLKIEHAYGIGQAIGTFAVNKGQESIIVGRDGRLSSIDLSSMLVRGLIDSGLDVIDIGLVPTPVLYFATHTLDCNSGVMVTGSHNPADYNGFKIIVAGETLSGTEIKSLYQLLQNEDDLTIGEGSVSKQDVLPAYVNKVKDDINLLGHPSIVIDCGHGAAGAIAEKLFTSLGCQVSMMFDEVDGKFPDHHPDPGNPENLQALIKAVQSQGADLGIAFDGDADRLGVVDSKGNIINPDRLLMVLAADLLMRNPGADILYDVKSSKSLAGHILAAGGNPVMWKSGHSLMKAKMKETGALLAGEFSGHVFYKERWYGFDDGLYTAARLLEILSAEGRSSAEVFAQLPNLLSTPEINLPVPEGMQQNIIATIQEQTLVLFGDAKVIDIDGIRAEYEHGWGLVRASNTTPSLTLRFEADDADSLKEIKQSFRSVIAMVLPDNPNPF